MRSGQLRHRLKVYDATPEKRPDGSLLPSERLVASAWAAIDDYRVNQGDEQFRMAVQDGKVFKLIRLRYRSDVTFDHQMYADLPNGRRFYFRSVQDRGERRREVVILAEERLSRPIAP